MHSWSSAKKPHPGEPPFSKVMCTVVLQQRNPIQESLLSQKLCAQLVFCKETPSRRASFLKSYVHSWSSAKKPHPGEPPFLKVMCTVGLQQRNPIQESLLSQKLCAQLVFCKETPSRRASFLKSYVHSWSSAKKPHPGEPPFLKVMCTVDLQQGNPIQESLLSQKLCAQLFFCKETPSRRASFLKSYVHS